MASNSNLQIPNPFLDLIRCGKDGYSSEIAKINPARVAWQIIEKRDAYETKFDCKQRWADNFRRACYYRYKVKKEGAKPKEDNRLRRRYSELEFWVFCFLGPALTPNQVSAVDDEWWPPFVLCISAHIERIRVPENFHDAALGKLGAWGESIVNAFEDESRKECRKAMYKERLRKKMLQLEAKYRKQLEETLQRDERLENQLEEAMQLEANYNGEFREITTRLKAELNTPPVNAENSSRWREEEILRLNAKFRNRLEETARLDMGLNKRFENIAELRRQLEEVTTVFPNESGTESQIPAEPAGSQLKVLPTKRLLASESAHSLPTQPDDANIRPSADTNSSRNLDDDNNTYSEPHTPNVDGTLSQLPTTQSPANDNNSNAPRKRTRIDGPQAFLQPQHPQSVARPQEAQPSALPPPQTQSQDSFPRQPQEHPQAKQPRRPLPAQPVPTQTQPQLGKYSSPYPPEGVAHMGGPYVGASHVDGSAHVDSSYGRSYGQAGAGASISPLQLQDPQQRLALGQNTNGTFSPQFSRRVQQTYSPLRDHRHLPLPPTQPLQAERPGQVVIDRQQRLPPLPHNVEDNADLASWSVQSDRLGLVQDFFDLSYGVGPTQNFFQNFPVDFAGDGFSNAVQDSSQND